MSDSLEAGGCCAQWLFPTRPAAQNAPTHPSAPADQAQPEATAGDAPKKKSRKHKKATEVRAAGVYSNARAAGSVASSRPGSRPRLLHGATDCVCGLRVRRGEGHPRPSDSARNGLQGRSCFVGRRVVPPALNPPNCFPLETASASVCCAFGSPLKDSLAVRLAHRSYFFRAGQRAGPTCGRGRSEGARRERGQERGQGGAHDASQRARRAAASEGGGRDGPQRARRPRHGRLQLGVGVRVAVGTQKPGGRLRRRDPQTQVGRQGHARGDSERCASSAACPQAQRRSVAVYVTAVG